MKVLIAVDTNRGRWRDEQEGRGGRKGSEKGGRGRMNREKEGGEGGGMNRQGIRGMKREGG